MIQLQAVFFSTITCNGPDNSRKDIACSVFRCFSFLVFFFFFHGKLSEFMPVFSLKLESPLHH